MTSPFDEPEDPQPGDLAHPPGAPGDGSGFHLAAGPGGRLRRAARALLIDITPLREHPAYRRMWFGETLGSVGNQLTAVAVPIQVYALTRSSFSVGLIGLVAVVPLIAGGLFGGAIADSVDRRKLALGTSAGLAVLSVILAAQAIAHLDQVWILYVVIAVQSALMAVNQPTRRAMVPRLVSADQIPQATALSQIGWNVALTGGPLLGGVAIAASGFQLAYGIDAVTFLAAMWGLIGLPPMPPEGGGTRAGVASVVEGLRFLRGKPVVLMTFVVDLVAMVFGMPRALFPQLAADQFHGGAQTVGLLYAAVSIGALVGAVSGGWFTKIRRQGLAVLVSVAVWGASIVGFGVTHALLVGVLMLAVAGGADMVSAVFRTAILQNATPDAMRGRLQGVFIVVVTGGPRLGDLEAGTAAAVVSPTFSVVSGGVVCLAGVAVLALLVPAFARYDAHKAEQAALAPG